MSKPTNLVTIRPGVTLEAAAAASFQRVEKRVGRRVDVNSSYRDWELQMRLYLDYQRHLAGGPWAPLALHPDRSMHCKGLAIDSDDHTIMRTVAHEHGWRSTVKSEPWHFDYFRTLDRHFGEPTGDESKPLPTPEPEPAPDDYQEDIMIGRFTYLRSDGKTVRVVHGEGYFEEHTSSDIKNSDINLSLNLPASASWPAMTEAYRDLVYNATLAFRLGTAGAHRPPKGTS